jgi:hypothetical protein
MSEDPAAPARRWGPFRTWEIVVIAIAIVLFVLAAFAGPRGTPTPLVSPTGGTDDPSPFASPTGDTSEGFVPVPGPTGSPVASADQIVADQVGSYELVDQGLSEAGAQGGALQSVELRYSLNPPSPETDIFHAVEVHGSADAARERVKTFGEALQRSGYSVAREQPLRNADQDVQGYFIALTAQDQRLLLWSNQNVTFSLGGGEDADVDAFYEDLPY